MEARKIVKEMVKYDVVNFKDLIKLDANERSEENLIGFKNTRINRYPDDNSILLKNSLSEYLNISTNNISVGNGSSEMIELLLKAFVDPEDVVLGFSPSFTMYEVFTKIYNGKYISVPAIDDYVFDIDEMISVSKDNSPKIIFICNPNNPTGYQFKKEDIERLIKSVNCLVVVDEAYIEFTEGSMLNRIDSYSNLVILRTFSKAWGLAGARLGYLVARNEITTVIDTIRSPYNLNFLSQSIGIAALKDVDRLESFVRRVVVMREKLFKELSQMGIKVYKSSGNFLYFKDSFDLFDKLKQNGILIRTFKNGFYRVTIGSESENKLFIKLLKDIRSS